MRLFLLYLIVPFVSFLFRFVSFFFCFFDEGASSRRDQGEDHRREEGGGAVPHLPAGEQARLRRVAGLLEGRPGGEHIQQYIIL